MKKVLYQTTHVVLTGIDFAAAFFALPWRYSDRMQRNIRRKINGKK